MKNILQYFEKTCEQFPNHIAVANESSSVTFNDLKTRSQQAGTMIASELKQESLPVAIYIDNMKPTKPTGMSGLRLRDRILAVVLSLVTAASMDGETILQTILIEHRFPLDGPINR